MLDKSKYKSAPVIIPGNPNRGQASVSGKTITIDPSKSFFTDKALKLVVDIDPSGGFSLRTLTVSGKDKLAFIILHELGHRAKIYGENDNDGARNITRVIIAQGTNNEKIWKACFSNITPVSGGDILGDAAKGVLDLQ